ncbi:hypothetical protein AB0D99_30580 [Streptomyces sp. NPDC047971]|uniref:hypothetical protein n=1 Tax=Streptomyces sp. NPDC047971 TaxID=3154499 RepID=UPI0033FC85D4
MSVTSGLAVAVFATVYVLIATERVHRVNATIIASSANVIAVGIADRSGHHISFRQFSRYGLVVTAVTITIAGLYVWLRYFALA